MQNNANKYVHVSDIATFYFCSKLTYFNLRRVHELRATEVRADIFKALSGSLVDALSSETPENSLESAIRIACDDELVIHGEKIADTVEKVRMEAIERINDMLAGLTKEKHRLGDQRFIQLLSPTSVSESFFSEHLRISGTIDRIVRVDGELMPVVISSSIPPPSGIYGRERIKIAAYSLLLAEKYGEPVTFGTVEYILSGQLREIVIRSDDKRKVLYARNRILEMLHGKMPDSRRGEWCKRCIYNDSCTVKVSFLDSLFKK
jgi:CRISPR-associated exonuclease Cas4